MPDEDPLEALSTLMERLGEMADGLGLKLETFMVLPTPKGQPHMAQAILFLDPEKVFKSPEELKEAEVLKQMDLHLRRDSVQEKIENARKGLIESLADQMGTTPEGLGLDAESLPEIKPEDAELIDCPLCGTQLTTQAVSPRPDKLYCSGCTWPFIDELPEPVVVEDEEEAPEDAPVVQATRASDLLDQPEPADPFDNMSVEEMMAEMERREREGGDGLAGV